MDVVGICNQALGWLGQSRITAINEDSRPAELCSDNWDPIRDSVLEARAWTFAVERAELAADPAAPVSGWSVKYQLPSDCLRVLQADLGDDQGFMDWQREGAFIVTDETGPIYVRYLKRVEDPALWSPGFCRAMAYLLAATLAVPLTENRALQADLITLYEKALRTAGALDGTQGRAEQRRSTWLTPRRA